MKLKRSQRSTLRRERFERNRDLRHLSQTIRRLPALVKDWKRDDARRFRKAFYAGVAGRAQKLWGRSCMGAFPV
jgi:hypothetical protein